MLRQARTLRIRRSLVACILSEDGGYLRPARDWRRDLSACYQPVYGHREYEVADQSRLWTRWVACRISLVG